MAGAGLTWTRRAHDLKAGVQLSRASSRGDLRNIRDGIYRFARDVQFDPANPASFPVFFSIFLGPTIRNVNWTVAGAFAQDSWQVRPELTFSLGVRYDIDGSYTLLNALIRTGKGLQTFRRDANNISPRFGIAWTPFDDSRRTLIRGGGSFPSG